MSYDFKNYQNQEIRKKYLKFMEYIETSDMSCYQKEMAAHFEEYLRLCYEYRNNRRNTERYYRKVLDDKKQTHEKEEVKRSICMKI